MRTAGAALRTKYCILVRNPAKNLVPHKAAGSDVHNDNIADILIAVVKISTNHFEEYIDVIAPYLANKYVNLATCLVMFNILLIKKITNLILLDNIDIIINITVSTP